MFRGQRTLWQIGLVVSLSGTAAHSDPQWALQSTSGPSPRGYHGMVYDSCRGVVVLVGGQDASQTYGDTWEWNGSAWSLRSTTGPDVHRGHAMAFDANRCVTVLFGGNDGPGNYLNDTWEWDGTTWTQKCTGGCMRPPTRHGAGMTFAAAQSVVVLFGGYSPGLLNDTWKWDGTTWMQVTTTSPPSPRSWTAMAYDPGSTRIVVRGGNLFPTTCGTNTDETWELDLSTNPATWTQITTTTQPSPRHRPKMVYDAARTRMVLFGGTDNCTTPYNDTWEYSAGTWTFVATPTAPAARHAHDMAYDGARQEVLLFGGDLNPLAGAFVGDTWTFGNRGPGIPAVGTWGLAVTALLLLSAGAVVRIHRSRA